MPVVIAVIVVSSAVADAEKKKVLPTKPRQKEVAKKARYERAGRCAT